MTAITVRRACDDGLESLSFQQFHHAAAQRVADQQVGLGVSVVVIALVGRRLLDVCPSRPRSRWSA